MEARYFKIGIFVVASVALGVAFVLAFGGKQSGEVMYFETYVNESVQGLDVGSHVRLRGVRIGKVDSIGFVWVDYETQMNLVRVVFSCRPGAATGSASVDEVHARVTSRIERGFRVRLASGGLTGGSYLEMDDVDPMEHPPVELDWTPEFMYIPSMPSKTEQFTTDAMTILDELKAAEIGKIGQELSGLIADLRKAVRTDVAETLANINEGSKQLPGMLERLDSSINEGLVQRLDELIVSLDAVVKQEIGPAAKDLKQTLADLKPQVNEFMGELNNALREEVRPALANIETSSEMLPETIARLDGVIGKLDRFVRAEAYDVSDSIRSLRGVLADLKGLTEDARRNPTSLIFGGTPPRSRRDRGK